MRPAPSSLAAPQGPRSSAISGSPPAGGFADAISLSKLASLPVQPPPEVFPGVVTVADAQMIYRAKSVGKLKDELSSRMLPRNGLKHELVARLISNDRAFGRISD